MMQRSTKGNQRSRVPRPQIQIYFSAHWCPPCRGFTPQLAARYKASAAAKEIEVVFVSSDKDDPSFREYFASMPWTAVPFGARDVKNKVSQVKSSPL